MLLSDLILEILFHHLIIYYITSVLYYDITTTPDRINQTDVTICKVDVCTAPPRLKESCGTRNEKTKCQPQHVSYNLEENVYLAKTMTPSD